MPLPRFRVPTPSAGAAVAVVLGLMMGIVIGHQSDGPLPPGGAPLDGGPGTPDTPPTQDAGTGPPMEFMPATSASVPRTSRAAANTPPAPRRRATPPPDTTAAPPDHTATALLPTIMPGPITSELSANASAGALSSMRPSVSASASAAATAATASTVPSG